MTDKWERLKEFLRKDIEFCIKENRPEFDELRTEDIFQDAAILAEMDRLEKEKT